MTIRESFTVYKYFRNALVVKNHSYLLTQLPSISIYMFFSGVMDYNQGFVPSPSLCCDPPCLINLNLSITFFISPCLPSSFSPILCLCLYIYHNSWFGTYWNFIFPSFCVWLQILSKYFFDCASKRLFLWLATKLQWIRIFISFLPIKI